MATTDQTPGLPAAAQTQAAAPEPDAAITATSLAAPIQIPEIIPTSPAAPGAAAPISPTLFLPTGGPVQAGPPGRRPGHGPWIWLAAIAGVLVLAVGAGAIGIALVSQHGTAGQPQPSPSTSAATSPVGQTTSASPTPASPAQVANDYVADVNAHAWPALWRLGGGNVELTYQPDPGPYTYSQMVANFQHTVSVSVTSLTSAGDTATMRISALDSAGVTQYFEIDLTVQNGRIVSGSQYFLGT